jgi:hypothetical protein
LQQRLLRIVLTKEICPDAKGQQARPDHRRRVRARLPQKRACGIALDFNPPRDLTPDFALAGTKWPGSAVETRRTKFPMMVNILRIFLVEIAIRCYFASGCKEIRRPLKREPRRGNSGRDPVLIYWSNKF